MVSIHDKHPHRSFMLLWILGAFAVLVSGMVGYMLQHPRTATVPIVLTVGTTTSAGPVAPSDTETSGVFTLAVNETGESHGWSITPLALEEDSRCPTDVQCIQAGTVRVRVRIGTEQTSPVTLTLFEATHIEGGKVTLLKVEPSRVSKTEIKKADYRYTFLVEKI